MEKHELIEILGNFLEEETTIRDTTIAEKWRGGQMILQPADEGLQGKAIDIEVFFTKIVRLRDNLRVLEQRINSNNKLSSEDKANMQQYITKSYGTLTTFNVFFKNKKDNFVGAGSPKGSRASGNKSSNLSVSEMKKKLGMNEY